MNNAVLGFDYTLLINMLMKQLYIAMQYFYVLNQITLLLWMMIVTLFMHHQQLQKVNI